jgi:penicillin amidase
MPSIAGPNFGASLRMIVSPGREKEGRFAMPCGQSGHPLSDFYRKGHDEWVRGDAGPFLPGARRYVMTLQSEQAN